MADNKNTLTSASLIPLGIGIAIGGGLLFALVQIWPLAILIGAGYCIHKGLSLSSEGTTGAKDAE
jgi:hypothetical protein